MSNDSASLEKLISATLTTTKEVQKRASGTPRILTAHACFNGEGHLMAVLPIMVDDKFFTLRKVVNGTPVLIGVKDKEAENGIMEILKIAGTQNFLTEGESVDVPK